MREKRFNAEITENNNLPSIIGTIKAFRAFEIIRPSIIIESKTDFDQVIYKFAALKVRKEKL